MILLPGCYKFCVVVFFRRSEGVFLAVEIEYKVENCPPTLATQHIVKMGFRFYPAGVSSIFFHMILVFFLPGFLMDLNLSDLDLADKWAVVCWLLKCRKVPRAGAQAALGKHRPN